MTLNYANFEVWRHFGNNKRGCDALNMHFCYNGVALAFQRALVIIKRLSPLTFDDCERSMTSKCQNIDLASLVNDKYGYDALKHLFVSQWNCLHISQINIDYQKGFPLTSEECERSMTSKYQNIDIWHHWLMINVIMMYMH